MHCKNLQKIYNYLQRFAVGLEEIVLDQALFDGEFIQEFNEAEYKLKAVSIEKCTVTKQDDFNEVSCTRTRLGRNAELKPSLMS